MTERAKCPVHDIALVERFEERGELMIPTGEFACWVCMDDGLSFEEAQPPEPIKPPDTPAQYAERLANYLGTRRTPWADEAVMREAVREVVGLMLASDAAYDTARLLPAFALADRLGKADWKYDDELAMHIPCCSQRHGRWRCGNGPLEPQQIASGDCDSEHRPDAPPLRDEKLH